MGSLPSWLERGGLATRVKPAFADTRGGSVDSTQRVNAKFTAALAAGQYQLTVTMTDESEGNVPHSATLNFKAVAE